MNLSRLGALMAGIGAGYLTATLMWGCATTDVRVLVEKNIYIEDSAEVEVDYTTKSDIDSDLKQELKDLLDLDLKLK